MQHLAHPVDMQMDGPRLRLMPSCTLVAASKRLTKRLTEVAATDAVDERVAATGGENERL